MNARRVGPLTGILFVAILAAAFIVSGSTPSADDSAQKVVSFYKDNDTQQIVSAVLVALACGAYLFFLGTLRQALRRRDGDEGGLSTVALLGGVMQVIGLSLFAALTFTLADTADDLPATATQAINALNSDLFFPLGIGNLVFNLGIALAVLRHGGLPRWLGWLALVIAIASVTPIGFFAFLADGIVIIAASVVLSQRAATA
jgi:hypothetical protein